MTKHLFLLTILFTSLIGCKRDTSLEDLPYTDGANLQMNVTGTNTIERSNLLKNMRIFLFTKDEGTKKGVLKHEVLNLTVADGEGGTALVTSKHVQAGLWTMVAISNLSSSDEASQLKFAAKYSQTREQLLYQFTPGAITSPSPTNVGADCPEIVILTKDIEIKASETEVVSASFKRAVGKVRVSIVSVTGNIKKNSTSHMVEISDVPSDLSLYGGLLDDNGKHSRKNHNVVDSINNPMRRPIFISADVTAKPPLNGIDKSFPVVDFIVPAYDDLAPEAVTVPPDGIAHTHNKLIWINIDLETENPEVRYKNRVQISTISLSANTIMEIKIDVKAQLTATVDIIKWDEVIIDSEITGREITGKSKVVRRNFAGSSTISVSGDLHYVCNGNMTISKTETTDTETIDEPIELTGNVTDFTHLLPADVALWVTKATWTVDQDVADTSEAKGHFNFEYKLFTPVTDTSGKQSFAESLLLNLKSGKLKKQVVIDYYNLPIFADRNVGVMEGNPNPTADELSDPLNSRPTDPVNWVSEIPKKWFTYAESLGVCESWKYQKKKWRQPEQSDFAALAASKKMKHNVGKYKVTSLLQSDGTTIYFPRPGYYPFPQLDLGFLRSATEAPNNTDGPQSIVLNIYPAAMGVYSSGRGLGMSLRCIEVEEV